MTIVHWPSRDALLLCPLSLSFSLFISLVSPFYPPSPVYSYASCYALARAKGTRTHARTHTHAPFLTLESRVVIISSLAIAVGKASGSRLEATAISQAGSRERGTNRRVATREVSDAAVTRFGARRHLSPGLRIPELVPRSSAFSSSRKRNMSQTCDIKYIKLYKYIFYKIYVK